MKRFLFYSLETTLCVGYVECAELGPLPDGCGAIESSKVWQQSYVEGGVVKQRPPMPIVLSGMQLENVPLGAVVVIEAIEYPVTDSTVGLAFNAAGTYEVVVKKPPFLDFYVEVTA